MQGKNDFSERQEVADRKKEVIDSYLERFVSQGLSDTSVRDLGNSLQMQSGALYWYFNSKDEAVIACAEEAALRLEINVIAPVANELSDSDRMIARLFSRAKEMGPTLRFFAQVCSTPRYISSMQPVLEKLSKRSKFYSEKIAKEFGLNLEKVEMYLSFLMAMITNYMLFEGNMHLDASVKLISSATKDLLSQK